MADRKNSGKPQLSLIDLKSLEDCARVLEFGAKKYSRDNWKKGLTVSSILDSLLRHVSDLQNGETIDNESGLPIIGHIQCNALFLGGKLNINDLVKPKEYDKSYKLCQNTPSKIWTLNHNMNKEFDIEDIQAESNVYIKSVDVLNNNTIVLYFEIPISGEVIVNSNGFINVHAYD